MTIQRLLVLLILIGGLATLALANWSPAVALVILGGQTQALPLGIWLVGAIALGAFTTLVLLGLAQLLVGTPPLYRSRQRRSSQPSSAYQSAYTPPPRDRTSASDWRQAESQRIDTNASPSPTPSTSSKWRSQQDDWSTMGRSPQDWGDWANATVASDAESRSTRQPSDQQTVIQDTDDLPWTNWQSYEDAEPEVIDVDVSNSDARNQKSQSWSNWRSYAEPGSSEVDDANDFNGVDNQNDEFYYERINTSGLDEEDDDYADEEDLDAIVNDWDDWDNEPDDYQSDYYRDEDYASDEDQDNDDDDETESQEIAERRREITEINRRPTSTAQSGSIYSYSYRTSDTAESNGVEDTEDIDDTESRVIIPPYRPDSDGNDTPVNEGDKNAVSRMEHNIDQPENEENPASKNPQNNTEQ